MRECQLRVSAASHCWLQLPLGPGMKHQGFGVDSQDLLPEESLSFTGLVTPSAAFGLAVESPVLEPVMFWLQSQV